MRVDAVGGMARLGYTSVLVAITPCGVARAALVIELRSARGPAALRHLAQAAAAHAVDTRDLALVQRRGRRGALSRQPRLCLLRPKPHLRRAAPSGRGDRRMAAEG